jgi:hypothetical protein
MTTYKGDGEWVDSFSGWGGPRERYTLYRAKSWYTNPDNDPEWRVAVTHLGRDSELIELMPRYWEHT